MDYSKEGDPPSPRPQPNVPLDVLALHSTNLLTVLDKDGVIQYESPSVECIFGYEQDEPVGDQVVEYFHPDDREKVTTAFEAVIANEDETVESVEYRHKQAVGTYIWVESVVSADPIPNGQYVINTRDISDQKEYEQELERQNQRLDRFAGVVSHDLRNPLTVIQGRLELAQKERESEHFDAMERSLNRINELINDLLILSRESDAELLLDAVSLQEISKKCWQNLDTEEATLDTDTEQAIVADESQFKQILENLFRNSIEHGGNDVTISVGVLDNGFYVEDNGRGISEDARDSLLEFGFSTKTDGTGFGLSIVNEIIANHDWTLNVTEGREGGARFEFRNVSFADR